MLDIHHYTPSASVARRRGIAGLFVAIAAIATPGCLYDSGNRCRTDQAFDSEEGICVCTNNTITGEHSCIPCGPNSTAKNDVCTCDDGFTQAADGSCQAATAGLGDSCTAAGAPCASATYSLCHETPAGGGYCTNACTTSDGCTNGYACDTAQGYCRRPPQGQGKSCASDTDCAGTEATWCDTFVSHTCVVQKCAVATQAVDCFVGYSCCAVAQLGKTLCVPDGTCPN